ncbi:MAG: TfoX/Sxy family protein [Thermoanaerobaculia bacterium]
MPRTNEFCDYVVDLLSPLGQASYKFMFGGYGMYLDGLMIAIVADDRLLLRADEENRPDYEALGIGPFQPYEGKSQSMPFYAVPDEVMDDPDELVEWARKALAATLRMKAKSGKKTSGGKTRGATAR